MAVLSTPGPMAVLSRQRQRMTRPQDSSRKLQFRYYPAQSIYQRPGQAVCRKSRPNGRCINGRSNGRFINARPNGRFIKVEATGWPEQQLAISLLSRTINLSAAEPSYFQAKAGPMAVLSTPGPMAVLTTGKLFSAKACPTAARGPMAVLSTPGPMAVLSRQRQRMTRPQDSSRKLQFRYYPAQSIYQRPGQAVCRKSRPNGRCINGRPNGRFINARPNGRFIKAEAAKWPDISYELRAANSILSRTISLSALYKKLYKELYQKLYKKL